MGNTKSSFDPLVKDDFQNFYEIIDFIASDYILTMDFKSLKKLAEKEYCDKLVVVTSDAIQKYFNDLDIHYLAQKIKNGQEVNEIVKEHVKFVNKDSLDNLDFKNDTNKSIKKKRVCIGIAKFYVKIAHIFAAIVKTINPVYVYKDNTGAKVKKSLLEKNDIPKGTARKLYKFNVCDNRIRKLRKFTNASSSMMSIHPNICTIGLDKQGNVENVENEPGIKELIELYYDDKYDYSNGNFTGMSDNTKRQYEKDLKTFYMAFTGKSEMPPDIQKFSDIKIGNFQSGCSSTTPIYKQPYQISINDKLFIDYAENIKKMIQTASTNQHKLLSILNELFSFVLDPFSKDVDGKSVKKIRVNPALNEKLLDELLEKTRNIIIQLYVQCERDFLHGINLYQAIVEKRILETTKQQIQHLEKRATEIIEKVEKPPTLDKPVEPFVQE